MGVEFPGTRSPMAPLGLAAMTAIALSACDRAALRLTVPQPSPTPVEFTIVASRPPLMTPADVDALLRSEWQKVGVTPTPPADDSTWLRRAWLDVLGTIPPPEVTLRFLADRTADKRARAIDEMLASPLWADHWTAYWDEVWMGRDVRAPDVDRGAFRTWLHDSFARNVPWNELVTELLTATGRNSEGGPKRDSEANEGSGSVPAGVSGAVNWTLKYVETPQDMAGAASRTLLGVQIQCAQCHDHKTETWKQKDFQAFAAAFVRTRPVPLEGGNPMGMVRRVELRDLDHAAPRFAKMGDLDAIVKAHPTALDGTDLGGGEGGGREGGGGEAGGPEGVRVALARWVTAPNNHWFAPALVNRVWGHFLGRGFVDPVDDIRPSNPASAPALLAALAADFRSSGYDVKHLVRVVVGTEGYARSAAPVADATAKADPETRLWERFRVTPLGPEELLNALVVATKLDLIVRATGRLDLAQVRFRVKQRYGFLFDVDEETDDSDYSGTIAQGLALLNGSVVTAGASSLPEGALAGVLAMPGDDGAKIEALYVRTLSRLPTRNEVDTWTKFVADASVASDPPSPSAADAGSQVQRAPSKKAEKGQLGQQPDPLRGLQNRVGSERASARVRAYEDVLWALLNSSEFVLNH
jgi:hypothetical protein